MHHELLRKLLLKYNHQSDNTIMMSNESNDESGQTSLLDDYVQNIRISRTMSDNNNGALFVRSLDTAVNGGERNQDGRVSTLDDYNLDGLVDSTNAENINNNGLDNPFLVNRSQRNGLRRLFLSSDPDDLEQQRQSSGQNEFEFNSDTRIALLGGLTIWQLTAVVLAFILVFCKLEYLFFFKWRFFYPILTSLYLYSLFYSMSSCNSF